jgi:hypothetical protein
MTILTNKVKSINSNNEEQIYDSITEAANKMIELEKYKNFSIYNIKGNISQVCNGKRNFCCDRKWVFIENECEDDKFIYKEEQWKQFRNTNIYFSKKYDFYYNINKKRKVYGDNKNQIKIYIDGKSKDYSILFIKALWITFNGEINENQYVYYKNENNKENFYNNIDIFNCICLNCNKTFINEKYSSWRQNYCSDKCKSAHRVKLETRKIKEQQDLQAYISGKIKKYKKEPYNLKIEDVVEKCKNLKCYYCDTKDLVLRNEKPVPNTLTIDAMEPEKGHIIENIAPCCLFCNRMKNNYKYDDWIKLLNFLKGDNKCLDLSNIEYTKKDDSISKKYSKLAYYTLMSENKEKYPTSEDARKEFLNLYEQQNKKDSIYNLFPIIMTTANNLLNASCDRIIAGKSDYYQIIPLFMQYGKNDLSQDEFKTNMKIRNYLNWNLSNSNIILPNEYYENSLFINKLLKTNNRFGKGHNGMKRSEETKKNISISKIGKNTGKNHFRSKKIKSIDSNGLEKDYENSSCAVKELLLPKRASSNILSCANGKLNTAYGYKWEFIV